MPLPITAVILTHRADQRFAQALASVQWADEVLVFDNHSQNNWSKLKTKFKFKVEKVDQNIENFSEIRNQAILAAQHEWVFFLDSDETLDKNFAEKLKTDLELAQQKQAGAISFKRKDIFHEKQLNFGETGSDRVTRLLHKSRARFVRPVHETVRTTETIIESSLTIKHYAHESIEVFINDVTRYAEIEAKLRKHQPILTVIIQLFLFPLGKFLFNYLWKLGFLDGWRGLTYAMIMSLHSLLVRIYTYENLTQK